MVSFITAFSIAWDLILIPRISLILRIFLRVVIFLRNMQGIETLVFKQNIILIISKELDLNQRLARGILNLRKIAALVIIVLDLISNRHPEQSVTY